MHFYSMSHQDFLALPIYTFWELSKNTDRLQANMDMEQLRMLSQLVGGDPNKYIQILEERKGKFITKGEDESEFDSKGFGVMKAMMSRGNK